MKAQWRLGLISILMAILSTAYSGDSSATLGANLQPASAFKIPPEPDRHTVVTVEYTAFEWPRLTWKGQKVACSGMTDHGGMPLPSEVYRDCAETVYNRGTTQKPCVSNKQYTCDGYSTFLAGGSCLADAITLAEDPASDVTWENISPFLAGACSGAIDYVNEISK
jgi:hypothetical protein